jgi:ABC-type nickel/cobalt efflux system permease component RcnA
MTRALARLGVALAVLGLILAVARDSRAHPAGFTSVNRYLGVACDGRGQVHLAYLLDFAELPAYAEIEQLDADHDGTVSPQEQRAYLDRRVPPIVAAWTVELQGQRVVLRVTGSSLEVLPGERGLSTLRIAADVTAGAPLDLAAGDAEVRVVDPVFADRSGWREMAGEDSPGTTVTRGPVARSADMLAYATPLAAGPPRVDEARFAFQRARPTDTPALLVRPAPPAAVDPGLSRLAAAMTRAAGSWLFSSIAIGLALGLGAAHALSPGHGKALAAAYLVGRRARASHAVVFGSVVTVAHTLVVFLVGLLALTVERTVGSDRLLRGLGMASAATVVALGIVQLSRRWREVTSHLDGHGHEHAAVPESGGLRSLVALGMSSGLAPCPSALALMLSAMALHRFGFGLVLVGAFSVGVAFTLTVTGILVVTAQRMLERFSRITPLVRWLPVMSSLGVLLLGVLLCASAWSPQGGSPW